MAEPIFVKETASHNHFEVKRQGYILTFVLTPDALECRLLYEPSTIGGNPLTEPELQDHLKQFKIREGIIPEAVAELLTSAASAKKVEGLLLAVGTQMVRGEDAQIIMAVTDELAKLAKVSPDKEESDAEKFDSVDFRHVQSFLNINEGELIATIKEPGPGIAGISVTGNIIPPEAGSPLKIHLAKSIRLGSDGKSLFANMSGRVIFKDDELSVSDVYEIAGDVDFKVGNIDFNGFVEIKGDVLDDFFVKATKGIKIQGNIGVCFIQSEGDISFCGMNGQGKGAIKCDGSISANFIYDTAIECANDLSAEIEIRDCHIKCRGAIIVNKGGITGGEYFALSGIQSGNLGSVTSLHTRVVAGVHCGDLAELNGLFNELKQLVAEFSAAPKGTLDMKEFARKRADITERTQEVRSRTYKNCNPKINVKNTLYEGVSITLGMITDTIKAEHKGPMSIIENSIEGGFRFLGMTPLSFKAVDIEQTFIQQYELEQKKKATEITEG